MKKGQPIPLDSYSKREERGSFRMRYLNAVPLGQQLRGGATLVLDAIDLIHAPIGLLAQRLGRALNCMVQVNTYAGWRESPGLDLHWDRHDVLVLQISGRKHWQVFGPTRRFPLDPDVEPCPQPDGAPISEIMLTAGDVLYLPRGWWHIATPCDEPTLHLTFGFQSPNASDLLHWLADKLKGYEVVRRDLPSFGGSTPMAPQFSEVRDIIVEACRDESLPERFLAELNARARPRTSIQFPDIVTGTLPASDSHRICLMTPRKLEVQPAPNGQVAVQFDGKSCLFVEEAVPLLRFLDAAAPIPIQAFYQAFDSAFDHDVLGQFLVDLASEGIVAFRE